MISWLCLFSGSELIQLGLGSIFPNSGHLEGSSARGLQHFKGSRFYHSSKIWYTHICIWMRRGFRHIIAKQINIKCKFPLFPYSSSYVFPCIQTLEIQAGMLKWSCSSMLLLHRRLSSSCPYHYYIQRSFICLFHLDRAGSPLSCTSTRWDQFTDHPVSYHTSRPVFLISEVISHWMMINNVFTSRVWVCGGRLDTESSLSMSWRYISTWRVERRLMCSER